ncbi:MAG: hypothetical protein COB30_014415, partial [Ectothiorhodospiraceae bacterium]|nr:hypothetical protein [Ectothiorhodospiraceae bacterium]
MPWVRKLHLPNVTPEVPDILEILQRCPHIIELTVKIESGAGAMVVAAMLPARLRVLHWEDKGAETLPASIMQLSPASRMSYRPLDSGSGQE